MADTTARFVLSAQDRTKLAIAGAEANLRRLGNTANTVRNALGLLAGAFVIREAQRFTHDALAMAGAIGNAAEKAGVTAEQLQVLRFAAEQNGSSADKLDRAIIKLNVNIGQTAQFLQGLTTTEGEARQALDVLGVSVLDAAGNTRTAAQILPELLDALAAVENPADRAGLAARVFGQRLGPELAVLINQGSGALGDYEERLRRAGALLDAELVEAGRRAEDQFGALGSAIRTNLQAGFLQGFLGSFRELDDLMTDPEFVAGVRNLGTTLGELMRTIVEQGPAVAGHLEDIRAVLLQISLIKFGAELGSLFGGRRGALVGGGIGALTAAATEFALRLKDNERDLERANNAQAARTRAVIRAAKEQAQATEGGTQAEADALGRLKAVRDSVQADLNKQLSEQKNLYDKANQDLQSALQVQGDVLRKFAETRAELMSGPPREEGASFLDAAGLGFQARQALQSGGAERALELADRAREMLAELNRQGQGGLASLGLLNQIEAVANAAAEAQKARAQTNVALAELTARQLVAEYQALEKIEVGFDNAAALASATSLRQAIEQQLAANPIVVPVVFAQDPNAGTVDQLIPPPTTPPGRASGGYVPGWSPHARADNVLIRATAGEYVLPVDAVRRLTAAHGSRVLDALRAGALPRGYALGGMIRGPALPRPELPSGAGVLAGPPSRTGGTTINLTLPGAGTFALSAAPDVAQGLARAVRREALKAGRRS